MLGKIVFSRARSSPRAAFALGRSNGAVASGVVCGVEQSIAIITSSPSKNSTRNLHMNSGGIYMISGVPRQFSSSLIATSLSTSAINIRAGRRMFSSSPRSSSSSVPPNTPSSSFTTVGPDSVPGSDGGVDALVASGTDLLSNGNVTDAISTAAEVVAAVPPALPNMLSTLEMQFIDYVHTFMGIPYWEAIVATTVCLRILMLPIAIQTIRNGARMAAMRPEMDKVSKAMQMDPQQDDMRIKMKYKKEMEALFVKYKVNPFRALLMPFFQLPIFISFFIALREMGLHYPDFKTGGDYWFVDLSAADPYFIFPAVNSITFLLMTEMGADGIQTSQQEQFKWVMRGLALAMGPLLYTFPQGLFVYWVSNNCCSLVQTVVLKNEGLRTWLDIPAPPAEAPALKVRNPIKGLIEVYEKEKAQSENIRAQIVDGSRPSSPMSSTSSSSSSSSSSTPSPPPQTFAMPPRRGKPSK